MVIASLQTEQPAVTRDALVHYLEKGCKPASQWRIGTEHEKFAYHVDGGRPLAYDGPDGIADLFKGLETYGWQPVHEAGRPIALINPTGESITLEPGGQVELSGAPLETVHQTHAEIERHLNQVKEVGATHNIGFLGLGYQPKWPRETLPWMPKGRYRIMRRYMPLKGNLGLDMMQSTCTVQVNLDFDNERTMAQMFRIALALQPIVTALFANSPFRDGKPNGYLSYRSHIWTDTDPDRCGIPHFVFEDGFGFERYVDYMLDVPMYFVYRGGDYIDVAGQSFRDFMRGRLPGLPGVYPELSDWIDHLTTAFIEVRLKHFLEMRGADAAPFDRLCALPAFWVGLLYDQTARDAALELINDWTIEEIAQLRHAVPRQALQTAFRERTVRDLAMAVLDLSYQGLARRNRLDANGGDETRFLLPLFRIAESGITPAAELLRAYHGRWRERIEPVFREYSY